MTETGFSGRTHLFHNLHDVWRTVSRDVFYLSALVGGSSNNTRLSAGYGSRSAGRHKTGRVHGKDDRNTSRTSQTAPNVTPGGHRAATKPHPAIYVCFVRYWFPIDRCDHWISSMTDELSLSNVNVLHRIV